MRRFLTTVALVVVGSLVIIQPAIALAPEKETLAGSFDYVDRSCGFRVDVTEEFVARQTSFLDDQGNVVRVAFHFTYQGTWTGRASGRLLIERETFNTSFGPTSAGHLGGLNWHFKLSSGRTVAIDAGKLVFDEEGNVVFEAGNHQIVDTNFGVLCPYLS